jgi:ABC-2 type transport system ATP-binding protein
VSENVIETERLTVYYGKHRGIEDVDLSVQRGEVFGFLGPNGAGKSTTQRVLLDVIRPSTGWARIFGLDCQRHGSEIRQRVGYLPGELSLYRTMTADDFLNLLQSINGSNVELRYRRELTERLDLDPTRKMSQYSRGNKQKVGLVAAFMGKPDLLILDEPTGGLDPLVQQTVLEMVREVKEEGRTVFFSSHILPEVQVVCDRVGIIREGKIIQTSRIEALIERQFKRLSLTLRESPPPDAFAISGVTEAGRDGNTIRLEIRDHLEQVLSTALVYGVEDIDVLPVTLEETFLAFYGHQKGGSHHG